MPKNPVLTAERLHELLSYDLETGIFKWKRQRSVPPGKKAGCPSDNGYIQIKVDSRRRQAHRLAWLYVHGRWPADQIDHINGVRDDNRIANLREANHAENQQNQKLRADNVSKQPGVYWDKKNQRWHAQIKVNKRTFSLGRYTIFADAVAARVKAKAERHSFQPFARETGELSPQATGPSDARR